MMNGFHTAVSREVDINITGNAQNNRDRLAKITYTMIKEMYSKEYSEMIPLFFGVHLSTLYSLLIEVINFFFGGDFRYLIREITSRFFSAKLAK